MKGREEGGVLILKAEVSKILLVGPEKSAAVTPVKVMVFALTTAVPNADV